MIAMLMPITLLGGLATTKFEEWKFVKDHTASVYNYIAFTISSSRINDTYRKHRRTNWKLYHDVMSEDLEATDLDEGLRVEPSANSLQGAIEKAL